jgi:hypothetical protein
VFQTETYDLFRHDARKILLLAWHGFAGAMLMTWTGWSSTPTRTAG